MKSLKMSSAGKNVVGNKLYTVNASKIRCSTILAYQKYVSIRFPQFSPQRCFFMSHFDQESFSGLRCFYSESCQAWIWTGEPADLENPSITVCTDDPNEEQCKKRRCGLIYDEQLASGRIRKASSNNLFSGVKDCYEQITGQQNGCYKQDISYVSSTQTWFGRSVLAWGECALICKSSRSTDHAHFGLGLQHPARTV